MSLRRWLRHLVHAPWWAHRAFPERTLRAIEAAVGEAEKEHRGEIRFAVEATLPLGALWHRVTPRDRALDVFSLLRVWDTELNTGVLVYVLLADRAVEIVADRGISAKVAPEQWGAICREMERAFGAGQFEAGALEGLRAIAGLLRRHFAANGVNPNELPNRPVLL